MTDESLNGSEEDIDEEPFRLRFDAFCDTKAVSGLIWLLIWAIEEDWEEDGWYEDG